MLHDKLKALATPELIKYAATSLIVILVTQGVLFSALQATSPVTANFTAVTAGGIVSFFMNKRWVWQNKEKENFYEIKIFTTITLLGLMTSSILVWLVAKQTDKSVWIAGANLFSWGLVWVLKYVLLSKLFKLKT